MKPPPLFTASTCLLLSASLVSQGITTPPGCFAVEGPAYSYTMGAWSEMRIQQADDTHRGNKSHNIIEVAFRVDHRNHTIGTAMGRSWTNISLTMSGQTNFETMSQTFTANIGNSPTIVFSSKWSWPTQSGIPLLRPDAWGSVGGRLRVPFSKPWAYSGKNSILADYSFRGGTLANAATWNTRTPGYYLDGEDLHRDYRYGSIDVIPELMQRRQCADSAFAPRTAATAGAGAIAYGRSSPMIALRGKLEFGHYSFWTAPGALVIHALGLAGSTKGVDIDRERNPDRNGVRMLALWRRRRGEARARGPRGERPCRGATGNLPGGGGRSRDHASQHPGRVVLLGQERAPARVPGARRGSNPGGIDG